MMTSDDDSAVSSRRWDVECDLLVIGSGAGGLSAAVTAAWQGLRVLVVEKDKVCGGATAWSGGWMWVPRNPLSQADGVVEDADLPRRYLEHTLGEHFDRARVDALLEAGPEMVSFFQQHTALQFVSGTTIADIHGTVPGAGTGGRSVAPVPVDGRALGTRVLRLLRPQLYETSLLGMGIMAGPDLQAFLHATRSPRAFLHAARRVCRHLLDLLLHKRGLHLVNGQALVGRLLKSADILGVQIWVSSPARKLLQEGEKVLGALVDTPGGPVRVRAGVGTLLATGGFPHDVERRRALFPRHPGADEHWPLPPSSAAGDGVDLGLAAGGQLNTSLASPAAWCPVSLVPYRSGRTGYYPHIVDRGKPGVIAVLADGRRFVNEADGYHQYVDAMLRAVPPGEQVVSWLICDHAFQRRYPFGMSKPFPVPVRPYLRSGYLRRGRTLDELARACDIDSAELRRTVEDFNRWACRGEDPAFGRGATPFNRGSGDPRHRPNPSLAPIERAPFYAIRVVPGSFGTFAGLATDPMARVLRADGTPVPGLYAAGSDQASVLGGHYPAGGINLGPAMTFGYVAGLHAAGLHGGDPPAPAST